MFAKRNKYQIIISDQDMPGITGTELTAKIKKINPEIPIIVYTGYSDIINQNNYKDFGVSLLFMKPMGVLEMVPSLKKILKIQ